MKTSLAALVVALTLSQGSAAFVPTAGAFNNQAKTSLSKTYMSFGDESSSWWGQSAAFNDDQVQTYVTPRRTKHGALFDQSDSIIDLSRWDDETFVYDQPSYRSGQSRSTNNNTNTNEYAYAATSDRSYSSYDNNYSDRYAYDEPRTTRSFDRYSYDRYDNGRSYYEPDYSYFEEPYYRSSDRYDDRYARAADYGSSYNRRYGNQGSSVNDESNSWWGDTYVVNNNQVQTYVKPREYAYSDSYGMDSRATTESDSWWGQGRVYNENQVQTYTRASARRDPMADMHYDDQPHYYNNQYHYQ